VNESLAVSERWNSRPNQYDRCANHQRHREQGKAREIPEHADQRSAKNFVYHRRFFLTTKR
jgi:hypothetical protein